MNFSRKGRRDRSTDVHYLLLRGEAAAKEGNRLEAAHYLEWVLRTESTEDEKLEAWYWLALASQDPDEKRHYLEEVLTRNPLHVRARRQLAILDGRLPEEEIVDPEKLPPTAGDRPQVADTHRFLCPRCAARMVFAPDGESLYCEHCGYGRAPGSGNGMVNEQDFIVAMATARGHSRPETMQAFQCEGCAAAFLLAPETISITCPYCNATYAVEMRETRELVPPQGIIPFAIEEEQAQRRVDGWLARQKGAGRAPVHGVYLPVWTFDIGGAIGWEGHGQEYEPSTRQWRPLAGTHPIFYDDYLVPGSTTLPEGLARAAINRFDLAQLVNFEQAYLAAWPAQTYEINVGDASLAARRGVLETKRQEVLARLEGRVNQIRLSTAEMVVESYKLLLLPLWIAHYRLGPRTYTIVVNGQTGAVGGERPRRTGAGALAEVAARFLGKWLT